MIQVYVEITNITWVGDHDGEIAYDNGTSRSFIADVPEKTRMLNKMQAPLRRLAEPEDTAGAVAYLLSHQSKFVTGETIRVCGGIVMC